VKGDYEEIAIVLLYPMVKASATNEVKKSIEEIGLQHPIVVIRTDANVWAKEKKEKYPQILDAPKVNFRLYQIRFGHNRVEAYKALGYTKIPAILADNAEHAADIGREQALWQKQKLGPL